jgi:hypothetical protein
VHNFLKENFHTLKNQTNRDHKQLLKTLQQSNIIIDKKIIKYLKQNKPQPPILKALIKLHELGNPIRPVINNINATAYKTAKHLREIFNQHLHLSNQYNVRNSIALVEDLTKLRVNESNKIITYHIKDLNFNIPIQETVRTAKSLLLKETTYK